MTDVHEETQFSFAHLLGMDMCLEAQAVLLTVTTVGNHLPGEETDDDSVEEVGPSRTVPWAVYHDGKATLRRLDVVAFALDTEAVCAWGQVGERQFVVSCGHHAEGLAVDTIIISNVFGVLVCER